jgi:hypothetical protein
MSVAQHIANSKSRRHAFALVKRMAEVEGITMPDYDELRAEFEQADEED